VNDFPYIHPNDVPPEDIAAAQRSFEKLSYAKPSGGVLALVIANAQNKIIQKINDTSGFRK